MSEDAIIEKLREVLAESAVEEQDWETVGRDTTIESLGIDSLSILDLLYDIDQAFGIQLDAKDVIDVRLVGQIADLLAARKA